MGVIPVNKMIVSKWKDHLRNLFWVMRWCKEDEDEEKGDSSGEREK